MTTEKHDPWALLREAREVVHAGVTAARSIAYAQWSPEQHRAEVLRDRIDAALAEHADSAQRAVESVVWRNNPDGEDAVVNNAVLSVWGWIGGWAWQRKPLAEPSYLNRTESGLSKTLDEAKSAAIAAARGLK